MTKSNDTPASKTRTAKARPATKLDILIALLKRPEGAELEAMTAATGWQRHSVRGALAGAVRKKGHEVSSEKVAERRVWRIVEAAV